MFSGFPVLRGSDRFCHIILGPVAQSSSLSTTTRRQSKMCLLAAIPTASRPPRRPPNKCQTEARRDLQHAFQRAPPPLSHVIRKRGEEGNIPATCSIKGLLFLFCEKKIENCLWWEEGGATPPPPASSQNEKYVNFFPISNCRMSQSGRGRERGIRFCGG